MTKSKFDLSKNLRYFLSGHEHVSLSSGLYHSHCSFLKDYMTFFLCVFQYFKIIFVVLVWWAYVWFLKSFSSFRFVGFVKSVAMAFHLFQKILINFPYCFLLFLILSFSPTLLRLHSTYARCFLQIIHVSNYLYLFYIPHTFISSYFSKDISSSLFIPYSYFTYS